MGFNCGIVGLPNVGKSTLFNALTESAAADAANYPFCTIEPNTGRVAVPDQRLDALAKIANSAQILPTQLEFVDIAGLVRGASKGEGLGNQFLHVDDSIDPIRDAETVETELMLADLDSLEKRMANLVKKARGQDKEAKAQLATMEKLFKGLSEGHPARAVPDLTDEERAALPSMQLLTAKPVLYVCNVDEGSAATGNELTKRVAERAQAENAEYVIVSAAIESEIIALDADEKTEFLSDLGLEEAGLARMIRAGYNLLNLLTFFTAGPKEARAWTVHKGATAPNAAGVIHTDFERGFIRAETISYDDYIACNGETGAKEAGKNRLEGKEYNVQDGDIIHFRHS